MRKYIGALFLLWVGALLVVYYVVQKPGLLNIVTGLLDSLWTLLVAGLLLFNAYGLGKRVLHLIGYPLREAPDPLLLGWGIGLGALGLLGLFFSVLQLANETILILVQISLAVVFLIRGDGWNLLEDLKSLRSHLNLFLSQYSFFTNPYGGPVERVFASTPVLLEAFLHQPQPLLSVQIFPISFNDQWWGLIGFDDCKTPREWDEDDILMLGTASEMIENTLRRWAAEKDLRITLEELEQRVYDRTIGLSQANAELRYEIHERQRFQDELEERLEVERTLAHISARL